MAALVFTTAVVAKAQTLQSAITKTMNERYESAESDFIGLTTSAPSVETYFYAGENYLAWGEIERADKMFEQAFLAGGNDPLSWVGLGRLKAAKGDIKAAEGQFFLANQTLNEKSANKIDKNRRQLAFLKMAETYIQAGTNLPQALVCLNAAQKLNETNPEVYVQFGDYYTKIDGVNLSNALAQYSKAYQLDNKYTRALLRQGQLYVKVKNWDEGLKYFNQAIEADPTFAPAYREKAELLYAAGRYSGAVESYAKYLELNNSCRVQQRYASFIFLTKDYKKAIEELEKSKVCNTENAIVYRVLGYAYFETGDFAKGLENINRFFELADKSGKPVPAGQDYAYRGKLLWKTGQDSLGVEQLKLAMSKDSTYKDGYNDIATIYFKSKKYDKAAEYYQLKIEKTGSAAPLDFFYLGQARYFNKEYALSDAAFEQAASKYPDAAFWRGRCNSKLDNQEIPTGMAKPFYEQYISNVGTDAKAIEASKKNLLESYSYLGFYYYTQKNFECSKAAWNKVMELDAVNEKAKIALSDKDIAAAAGTCELIAPKQ